MKAQTTKHRLVVASALALLLAASVAAKKEDAKKDEKPPDRPIRVAVMPIVNGSSEIGATKIMEDVLRDRFKEVPAERATFLLPPDTERILTDRNMFDRAYSLNDRWSKYGTLDSTAVAGLDSLLMVDAILFAMVAEWDNVRVNVVGRGESNTTVGLNFALYDLKSLKKTWSKTPREQRFAQEVDPTGPVTYDETGYIQSRKATDPPRFEDVANDLVRTAFKKFPSK
jgi:hypothetical protein